MRPIEKSGTPILCQDNFANQRHDLEHRPRISGHMARRRESRREEGGYSTIEATFIIPLTFLLATIIPLQVMLLWFGQHISQSAARQGVEIARGYGRTDDDARKQTTSYLHSVAPTILTAPQVDVTRTEIEVTVRVRSRVVSIAPGMHWSVTAQASGPIERFVG